MAWKERATGYHTGFMGFIVHTVIRFLQLIGALTVLGLYGTDLNNARLAGKPGDGKWIYAEVTGGIAAVTALVFMVPFIKTFRLFPWDTVVFILWIALFGLFGSLYIKENPEGNAGIQRMKNAVWVDLANALLWLISAVYGAAVFFLGRKKRSLHTGRAVG